ncbi:DUF6328 family protein [Kitasatospora cheerisanensis]|uniref:Uncharacterized protein n=1 Tax=Kitasatospora cheerisanensis KCTC 2395 TaxID=1348663 RepID=A0A066Z231_9ACTN|nr:hypothetical protein KCH_06770 [Kitasatospora cheerisanensis KCTC 2395]
MVPEDGRGRHETPNERADRRWTELLQEVRVVQTGAQILFGFLLSVVFMPRFAILSAFERGLYVVTVVLGALATGALIAPVAYHRLLAGRRLKPELVDATSRVVALGVVLLALTVGSALLLLLHVAIGGPGAGLIVGGVMAWFTVWWLLLPWLLMRRSGVLRDRPGGAEARRRAAAAGRRSTAAGRPGKAARRRATAGRVSGRRRRSDARHDNE